MTPFTHQTVRLRAAALWGSVTLGVAGVTALTAPVVATAPDRDFTGLLTWACATTALTAALALWVVTCDVVWSVLGGRTTAPDVRRTGPVRALLLAACGVVVFGAPAGADTAETSWLETVAAAANGQLDPEDPHAIAGLPLPDRPGGDHAHRPSPTPATSPLVTVRPGDSLWRIAAARLGDHATVAEVASYTYRIHRHNADVIGADPDLILPGQELELPRTDGRDPR